MSQVLLMAYKIQRGNQNKSLLSLDDLGTTFQTGKQNKLSRVLMDYNISDRKAKQSLRSLDALQHLRQKSKTNLSQVLMPYNISDRRETEGSYIGYGPPKGKQKTLHIARRACKQRERRRVIREKWSEEGELQEVHANRDKEQQESVRNGANKVEEREEHANGEIRLEQYFRQLLLLSLQGTLSALPGCTELSVNQKL